MRNYQHMSKVDVSDDLRAQLRRVVQEDERPIDIRYLTAVKHLGKMFETQPWWTIVDFIDHLSANMQSSAYTEDHPINQFGNLMTEIGYPTIVAGPILATVAYHIARTEERIGIELCEVIGLEERQRIRFKTRDPDNEVVVPVSEKFYGAAGACLREGTMHDDHLIHLVRVKKKLQTPNYYSNQGRFMIGLIQQR